jgi:acid phosphatase type 7
MTTASMRRCCSIVQCTITGGRLQILLLLVQLLLFSQSYIINVQATDVVHIRKCPPYTPRHITLAVGADPSTEMIITFATTQSNLSPPPYAGIFISQDHSLLENFFVTEQANAERQRNENIEKDVHQKSMHLFLEDLSDGSSPTYYKVNVNKDYLANDGKHGGKRRYYYSPFYHHITMKGLQPDTVYYYRLAYHTEYSSYNRYRKYLVTNSTIDSGKNHFTLEEFKAAGDKIKKSKIQEENDSYRRNRKLIQWGPYNPSVHSCPDAMKIRHFRTAPTPGTVGKSRHSKSKQRLTQQASVNIAVVGDIGQFPHSQETASHLFESRDNIDTILLVGDLAYNEYDPRRWDTFLDFFDDYEIAHNIPMQIVPGNHDIDKLPDDNAIFLAYEHRFRMPRVNPPQLGLYSGEFTGLLDMDVPPYPLPYEWGNAYYAYTYGPARIIMISSYSSLEPESTQYEWIVSELNTVDRSITPWVIAILHTPMYNTFSVHHHDLQIIACKQHLEPLLIHHEVNLVFTGHIHAYLRTTNVVYGVVDPVGPIHVTVGAGGRNCDAPFLLEEQEPWVGVRDATYYGYGMIRIFNDTHAEWEWIHTGQSDDHPDANELYHSNFTLPAGPPTDHVMIENVFTSRRRRD